jgi:glucose/arabinose dehydrogenase
MKTIMKIAATTIVLVLTLIADISLLSFELVPEAHAIFGVRRRTAVVAYSVGKASAANASAAAASQQQNATAQQQAAVAQQQATTAQQQATVSQQQLAASQAVSGVPIGTVVEALPAGCKAVTVSNNQYQDCGGSFYKAAFQGNKLIYVVVGNPL